MVSRYWWGNSVPTYGQTQINYLMEATWCIVQLKESLWPRLLCELFSTCFLRPMATTRLLLQFREYIYLLGNQWRSINLWHAQQPVLEAWAQLRMSLTWNILLALQRLSFHLPRWWLEIIQQMLFLFSSANSHLVLHLAIFTLAHDHNYFVNSIKKWQMLCSYFQKIQWCISPETGKKLLFFKINLLN